MQKIIILMLFLFSGIAAAQQIKDPNEIIVNKIMTSYMQKNQIPGASVELFVDGKPYEYYFGYADRDKKIPVSENTIFELGSISKVMTSLLLAQEIDDAKVQLNDPIIKALPELPKTFEKITFKNLATHTSGLPFDAPDKIKNQTELEAYLTKWKPKYAANTQWIYSSFGIGMMGEALEAATHKNFNQLFRKQILAPLGMQPIALNVPNKLKSFYAQGYTAAGKAALRVDSGLFPAAGAMKASSLDMQRFLSATIGLPSTPEEIFYPMRMTQTGYVKLADTIQGLGWEIHPFDADNINMLINAGPMNMGPLPVVEVYEKPIFDGDTLMDKTGTTKGFRAYIAVIPNKKTGIVILTNKHAVDSEISNVGREILFRVNKVIRD